MNIQTLEKFTSPTRKKFSKPFTYQGKTYATDGYILIRTNEQFEGLKEGVEFPYESIRASFEGNFGEPLLLRDFSSEEETETCRECNGTGTIKECPECEGSGEVELDTGYNFYSFECETCGGSGTISDGSPGDECETCGGTGKVSVRKLIEIGSSSFDNRLVNKLISNLPEDTTITPSKDYLKAAVIKWSEGEGLLMPCRF